MHTTGWVVAWIMGLVVVALAVLLARATPKAEGFATEAPGRPCTLYYTQETTLCDKYDAGMLSERERRGAAFRRMKRDMQEKSDGQTCRLVFPGWKEFATSVPKNVADAKLMDNAGPAYQWAFCFREGADENDVRAISQAIGDRGAFAADPAQVAQLENGVYARLHFQDMAFDKVIGPYCELPPPADGGVPEQFLVIDTDTTGKIQGYDVMMYRNGAITKHPRPMDVLGGLFRMTTSKTGITLAPSVVPCTVFKFNKNVCGHITPMGAAEASRLNLPGLGVRSTLLLASNHAADLLGGVPQIERRMLQFQEAIGEIRARVAELEETVRRGSLPATDAATGTAPAPVFEPRLVMSTHRLASCGPLASPEDVDAAFAQAKLADVQLQTSAKIARLPDGLVAVLLEGYLDIKSDMQCEFYVNAAGAADMYVDQQRVATHYGIHAMDGRGVSSGLVPLSAGKHHVRVRVVKCMGAGGVDVQWREWNPRARRFLPNQSIPANAWCMDRRTQFLPRYEMATLARQADALEARVQFMRNALDILSADMEPKIRAALEGMRRKPLGFPLEMRSNDGRYYLVLPGAASSATPAAFTEMYWLSTADTSSAFWPRTLTVPKVPMGAPIAYTIAAWVRVDGKSAAARNLFQMGPMGVWIQPRTGALLYRHASSRSQEEGMEVPGVPSRWFHLAVVATVAEATMYVDGKPRASVRLPAGITLRPFQDDKIQINSMGLTDPAAGDVRIQKLVWAHAALPESSSADHSIDSLFQDKP